MAFIDAAPRVAEVSTTTGSGAFTLNGAVAAFQAFSAVCAVGDTMPYWIVSADGSWEQGIGTYSAANTLTRTTLLAGTNGASLVVFAAGTKSVYLGYPGQANLVNYAAAKATPADADKFGFFDSVAVGLKALTWANIKTALQAAFDARYTPRTLPVAISDEVTALATGLGKVTFHAPYAMSLTEVMVGLTTPQASGVLFTVDVRKNGVSVFTTKPTIDNTESTTVTAATAAVLTANPLAIAKGDAIAIDIAQIGDGTAKGCKVYFNGTNP